MYLFSSLFFPTVTNKQYVISYPYPSAVKMFIIALKHLHTQYEIVQMLLNHVKYKWGRHYSHMWVWCLVYIEAKPYSVSHSCKTWHQAKHLWSIVSHWLLLHSITLLYYYTWFMYFLHKCSKRWGAIGQKMCAQHKEGLIAFYSQFLCFSHTSALWCLSILRTSLFLGVSFPFSNMWALCQLFLLWL